MLENYLVIIQRNIARHPGYTILNLSCLALSIAAVLYVLLYLNFELNYDRFHPMANRIYRIDTKSIETHEKVMDVEWRSTPANLGTYLQQDYPGIEAYARLYKFWKDDEVKFQYEGKVIEEEDVFAADASVFEVFSFDLIKGDPHTALNDPNKIVLSESLAQRIFDQQDPIGKILSNSLFINLPDIKKDNSLMVTGVYRDLPKNTHLIAEALISAETDSQLNEYYFNEFNVFTYVLLSQEVKPATLAPKLSEIYDKYLNAEREPVLTRANHELIPLAKIHMKETGGHTYIYIFSAVSLLLLLIASISYVNLVTAQASRRSLEIGIRKVLGSHRRQLTVQFLAESLFFTLLALVLAIVLVVLSTSFLNEMLGLQLDTRQLWQFPLLLSMLAIVLLLGILGGSYPAFFLSSFEPITVMKGTLIKGAPLRKGLVTVQFFVVIFVLTCTGMIYDQLQYLRQKDLGFDKEHIIMLTLPEQDKAQKWEVLKGILLQSPYIVSSGMSSFTPGTGDMRRGPISAEGSHGQEQKFAHIGRIDDDFLETMNIGVVAGRNFSEDFPGDSSQAVIVNETLVRNFSMDDPIGKKIRFGSKDNPNFFQVIGVIKDFHQSSLHHPIEPQMFLLEPSSKLAIRIGEDLPAGMGHIEKSWAQVFPNTPFSYHFLDVELQDAYEADQIRGKIFFLLSLLTIFISFLGLFGLASYLARQRIKEIGIRKVFGASLRNLIVLMTQDFLLRVVISALPAFMIAWFIVSQWLENFAFRTGMNYLLFGLVLLITLLLTFLTTGLHALRSAQLNPAKTLKHE